MEGNLTKTSNAVDRDRQRPEAGGWVRKGEVLLVEDDPTFGGIVAEQLADDGHSVRVAPTLAAARTYFADLVPDVAILDLRLPDGDGMSLLREMHKAHPGTTFIMLSGYASVGVAVEAMREGALDFVEKPVRLDHLSGLIARALQGRELRRKLRSLEADLERARGAGGILGRSERMQEVLLDLDRLAGAANTTVLLCGESGTGKELGARAIHSGSARRDGPFVAVNCASLTQARLEQELFGMEPSGYAQPVNPAKEGLFEAANGGTILLDEIAELDVSLQGQLLRVLEDKRVRRVGGVRQREIDVRVLASTNHDLHQEVAAGRFRKDLYFRLSVATVRFPPLRERGADVQLLADHYLAHFLTELRSRADGFDEGALAALRAYPWPGNVRELRNKIEYAVIRCPRGRITATHLGLEGRDAPSTRRASALGPNELADNRLATIERIHIERVIELHRGNVAAAARDLGITRQTLYNKLRAHELPRALGRGHAEND